MHSNPPSPETPILRLILGDQLSHYHSWFKEVRDDVVYLMAEVQSEASYVRHHIQKVLGFFQAMRIFAEELEQKGHRIIYVKLDVEYNQGSLSAECLHQIKLINASHFAYQEPDEWRLKEELRKMCDKLTFPFECVSSEHFLSDDELWSKVFKGKKSEERSIMHAGPFLKIGMSRSRTMGGHAYAMLLQFKIECFRKADHKCFRGIIHCHERTRIKCRNGCNVQNSAFRCDEIICKESGQNHER